MEFWLYIVSDIVAEPTLGGFDCFSPALSELMDQKIFWKNSILQWGGLVYMISVSVHSPI